MSPTEIDPISLYSTELLKELHILTRDAKLNQDSRRKLKQIEHLGHLCFEQLIKKLLVTGKAWTLCDVGAGKNYFSFLLWDRYFRGHAEESNLSIYSIESRNDLNQRSLELAEKIGLKTFFAIHQKAEAAKALLPKELDVVIALHACDTATDDAIKLGIKSNAKAMALVPCCQAEISRKLSELKPSSPLYPLWRFPLHSREFGSHLTNVIRTLYLESHGYKVRCTEFVGFEHSLKNEVILAEKVQKHNSMAEKALKALLEHFPIEPYLLES